MLRLILLWLVPLVGLEAAEKRPAISIRLHAEGNPSEGESFVTPVTLVNPPKQTVIRKVPIVTERDIVAFYPFAAADGTIGCYFKLDADGTNKLTQHTIEFRDTLVVALINGRVACVMMVGEKVTDGIMPFPSGFLPQEIVDLQARYPIIGREKGIPGTKEESAGCAQGGGQTASQGRSGAQERPAVMVVRTAFLLFFCPRSFAGGAAHRLSTDNRALLEGKPQVFFHVREPRL
jgi:hypothetical protein